MLQVLAAIFLILSLSVAGAQTPEVAAQRALVAELQNRANQLDAEIRILGGGHAGPAAAKGLANRVKVLEDKITSITRASTELAAGRDDFERLRQIVNDERVVTLADLALEGVKDVPWKGTKNLLELARNPAAKKSDDAFEYLGTYALRDINEWTIRDLVRAEPGATYRRIEASQYAARCGKRGPEQSGAPAEIAAAAKRKFRRPQPRTRQTGQNAAKLTAAFYVFSRETGEGESGKGPVDLCAL